MPDPEPEPPAPEPPMPDPEPPAPEPTPDFRERGALRRRARYLRRLREVQLRDLGGLVVELHRFGRERPDLVEAKVAIATNTASELRTLELALHDRRSVRELREPGIGGPCSQCGALHGSSDRFCASCGLPTGPPPDPNGELDPAPTLERGKPSDPSTQHAGPAP
jgi:hypothetical protein